MGRRQIGQALLRYLREYQGLPADAPWGLWSVCALQSYYINI